MHTDEYYRDLMNAEIDGIITEEETRLLNERLRTDPEARACYEDLRRTVSLLDGARELVPPAGLRERVMRAVRANGGAPAPRGTRRGTWWRRGYIPMFAAGTAAGLLLFAAFSDRGVGPAPAGRSGGTIGLDSGPPPGAQEWATRFEGSGVSGRVAAVADSAGVSIAIILSAVTEATALFEFGPGLQFEGISSLEGAPFQMEVERGSLMIVHNGAGEYRVRLRGFGPARGPVALKVFAGGELVAGIPIEAQ